MLTDLPWLPVRADWTELLNSVDGLSPDAALRVFQALANSRMDFVRAGRLDKHFERYRSRLGVPSSWPVIRLALLGSSTLSHLAAGLRLGGLRRGLIIEIYQGLYGQYRQELLNSDSGLHAFRPDVICFALDAYHVTSSKSASAEQVLEQMRECWHRAQDSLQSVIVQQTLLPILPLLMGNNEHRLSHSAASLIEKVNHELRRESEAHGVYLLSVDTWAAVDGTAHWHDRALWNRSKQEIHPRASVAYGEQLVRLLAALRGKSSKCLVLDLDNTLWGGVIGDDGLDGIVLGQGTAVGEAHLNLQRYAANLNSRGVLLAVCSKNDEKNAVMPFEHHPEMLLKRTDIASFVANWDDKASNLRDIAASLNIGLDSLVFVDDNPAERALIRRELPEVAVPELPEDPAEYVQTIAAAGYFEATQITNEDRKRAEQYRANAARDGLRRSATDLKSFLEALRMELTWSAFEETGLSRVSQLINKTNQFNLMTRRHTEAEVVRMLHDPKTITLQLRLTDIYGDNGIIAVVIAHRRSDPVLTIDTWVMSCRVLGRAVEDATLHILVRRAHDLGCTALVGTYNPTAKNGLVAEHYKRLGFKLTDLVQEECSVWLLNLSDYVPKSVPIRILEKSEWKSKMSMVS